MTSVSPVSRRHFLHLAGGALGLAALGSARAQRSPDITLPDDGMYPPKRFTIDAHVHWRPTPEFLPKLLKHYRARNAMACVNCSFEEFPLLLAAAKEHPDVIIPFVRVTPDDNDALAKLDDVKGRGARGLAELSGFKYDWSDERYFPYYEKVQSLGLVALFHSMATGLRTQPVHLGVVASRFRQMQIICAHMGNPDFAVAAELARLNANIVVEISSSGLLRFQSFPEKLKEYLWWNGPNQHSRVNLGYAFDQLVFATDEPPDHLATCLAQYEAILQACAVPESTRQNVYGRTLAKILGIPVRA